MSGAILFKNGHTDVYVIDVHAVIELFIFVVTVWRGSNQESRTSSVRSDISV